MTRRRRAVGVDDTGLRPECYATHIVCYCNKLFDPVRFCWAHGMPILQLPLVHVLGIYLFPRIAPQELEPSANRELPQSFDQLIWNNVKLFHFAWHCQMTTKMNSGQILRHRGADRIIHTPRIRNRWLGQRGGRRHHHQQHHHRTGWNRLQCLEMGTKNRSKAKMKIVHFSRELQWTPPLL